MHYTIRTLSVDNLIGHLTVDAHDEADARRQAEAQGLTVATITTDNSFLFGAIVPRARRAGRLSLVLFSQELLALLTAGLSIVESLEALLEKETAVPIRATLTQLLSGLYDGKQFSGVLAEQPALFSPLYVGIVKAAEGTSDLPRSLARFIDYQQRIDTISTKILSAAIYPMILLAVGGSVTAFLICYVVPRFAEVYRGAGRDLPWMSQLLLDWGQFATSHAQPLIVSAILVVPILAMLVRRGLAQGGVNRLLAGLPGIGERVRIYALSRLYLTLGMLLDGGIPILPALQTVKGMVPSDLRLPLSEATESIASGTALSVAFETHRLTTPISARLLRVGERTGDLGAMLTQSAAFYDGEISRWIDRFTRMFEPLLMALIGVIVGAIVVLLYMPIFDLAGSLS